MNKKIAILLGMVFLLLPSARAMSPLAPIVSFEMASHYDLPLDGNDTTASLVTLHQSSSNWLLYLRHNDADVFPYDNMTISIKCNNAVTPTVFHTTSYADWVNNGSISINFNYQDDAYVVYFNSISFAAKYSSCVIGVDSGTFDDNGAYDDITLELIPQLGVLEFISCTGITSPEIGVTSEGLTFVQIMTDVWNILWNVYSLMITVIALFGIPMMVFIIFRWAVFKITGYKIGAGAKK
jgi:hypothetical protein